MASEKEVWKSRNDTITERAKDIPQYRAVASEEQTFVLDVDGKVITFYYESLLTNYTVKYLDVDDEEPLYPDKRIGDCEVGSMVSENAIAVSGYTALAPTEVSLVLAESGNVIIFYYEREPVLTSYTIRYLDTTHGFVDIAKPKTVTDVAVGESITEFAIDIEGFSPLYPSITFIVNENGNNQLFYYFSGDPSGD